MNNARICHLTVLNSVLHSRIFFKQAISQQKAGYQVFVIGCGAKQETYYQQEIQVFSLPFINRTSWKRFFRPWQVVWKARNLKTNLYVLHTPELILPAILLLPLSQIVYDIHEDYLQNILSENTYPKWVRKPLAILVRSLEYFFTQRIAGITVAEKIFYPIFFPKNKQIVIIENKCILPNQLEKKHKPLVNRHINFVLTGNLSETWGLFRAIHLFKQIVAVEEAFLTIAGFCPHSSDYENAVLLIQNLGLKDQVKWIGGLTPVSYPEIMQQIAIADAGFALYSPKPNIITRTPTKFFEYLATQTPLIFTDVQSWNFFSAENHLGFNTSELISFLERKILREKLQLFYEQSAENKEVWSWEYEQKKLIDFYSNILGQ